MVIPYEILSVVWNRPHAQCMWKKNLMLHKDSLRKSSRVQAPCIFQQLLSVNFFSFLCKCFEAPFLPSWPGWCSSCQWGQNRDAARLGDALQVKALYMYSLWIVPDIWACTLCTAGLTDTLSGLGLCMLTILIWSGMSRTLPSGSHPTLQGVGLQQLSNWQMANIPKCTFCKSSYIQWILALIHNGMRNAFQVDAALNVPKAESILTCYFFCTVGVLWEHNLLQIKFSDAIAEILGTN